MMIHGSMIWNFVNSMPQVYRGSPLVAHFAPATPELGRQWNNQLDVNKI